MDANKRPDHSAAIHYRTVKVDGVDIFYREAGASDAPMILLLHGFPSAHTAISAPIYAVNGHIDHGCASRMIPARARFPQGI
jgi:pimeloyl-ACP methyl ester carboxylesterase